MLKASKATLKDDMRRVPLARRRTSPSGVCTSDQLQVLEEGTQDQRMLGSVCSRLSELLQAHPLPSTSSPCCHC